MLTTSELKRMYGKIRYWLSRPYVREYRWKGVNGTGFSDYTDNQILLGVFLQKEVDQLYDAECRKRGRLREIQREVKSFMEQFDEDGEIDQLVSFQQVFEDIEKETGPLVEELEGPRLHFAWLAHRFHGLTWKTPLLNKESKKWAELCLKARNAQREVDWILKDIQAALDNHFLPGSGDLFLQAKARFTEARQTGS